MKNDIREYLSKIGKRGGKVTSEAKAAAVRENGKKGGRPKGARDKAPRKPRKAAPLP